MSKLKISEIFGPTIQGEGALIGEPTVFVRSAGCDYRCAWCDTPYAVDAAFRRDWQDMETETVWEEIQKLSGRQPLLISLSGGNPAIQDFNYLISTGKAAGYRFACETQGSIARDWFSKLDMLVLSPKPPSSRENVKWEMLDACLDAAKDASNIILKIVIFDDKDYIWAQGVSDRYSDVPLYLQPGNEKYHVNSIINKQALTEKLRWLIDKTMTDKWFKPKVLPQLHVVVWGNKRGV